MSDIKYYLRNCIMVESQITIYIVLQLKSLIQFDMVNLVIY